MDILRDIDCTIDTPVELGKPKLHIYGQGHNIMPRYPGKRETASDKKIYLEKLLPLEEYDHIIVLFSGGKDSTAAYYSLIEMGVPKAKIQLWHHDLDGGHPSRIMDWPVTKPYVRSFATAEGVKLQVSQRVNGFWGEVYRIGSPYPIEYEQDGKMVTAPLSVKQENSEALRREIMASLEDAKLPEDSAELSRLWCSKYEELLLDEMLSYDLQDLGRFEYVGEHPKESLRDLEQLGNVGKFPAKSSIQNGRWCSSRCKKEVGDKVIRDIYDLKETASHLRLPQKRASAKGRFCTGRCKNDVGDVVIRDRFSLMGAASPQYPLVLDSETSDPAYLDTNGTTIKQGIHGLKEQGGFLRFPLKTTIPGGRYCSSTTKEKVFANMIRNLYSLKEQGYHLRLPAKGALLNGRYCTSVGKAKVYEKSIRQHMDTKEGVKILVVSGERRGESVNRSKYNEIELSSCNATAKGNRLVHHWRLVIDFNEADIWEVLKRHHCVPHPCYALGWNRCSCAMCIFSKREQWAGVRELFPDLYEEVCQDEVRLGFTLNVYQTLDEYVGDAESCVYRGDPKAMSQMLNGVFMPEDLYTEEWYYPAGAFHGSEGGPC